ncbi:hypothetical protein P152DRAFT_391614 [Eremomyces bilateralis CBS 781.70]|uniref:Sodium/calcium exchanger membrane region domain-containing protein n=1 Tax=Eremomyces bilateralis CBS 781.70 TaxID=1392243 RepID=A0A6G1GAB7_9PEZI|nr:uncharacterized protein P152DRAFT_391614 [Eremomyces bilateralis CBS 781.70]KAF1814779.1 hypothetical protein P152DRAFT_391614 [Eremomyces bilateralis CBS 781.70]
MSLLRVRNGSVRFVQHTKKVLTHSWVNVLLIFVPIGIAMNFATDNPELIFAMNAVAIVPLAGMLGHATENVASELGDTVGALLNVTFGNAVELIIFMYVQHQLPANRHALFLHLELAWSVFLPPYSIALVKNEIRIVQASLIGSILANLLLILGMAFVVGGLRYREQIYNSTVTQMSACMLSLSVLSLVLPTAFHASFSDSNLADQSTLKISRGTSVILLIVYVLYLLFQLKSHAYLYESTPQHIIDEESHPGLLADVLGGSSSSSSSDDSSSSSDSDSSSGSHTTAKRIRKAFRHRRRRKSSVSSKDTQTPPSDLTTSADHATHDANGAVSTMPGSATHRNHNLGAIISGDEADIDGDEHIHGPAGVRDFGVDQDTAASRSLEQKRRGKKQKRKYKQRHHRKPEPEHNDAPTDIKDPTSLLDPVDPATATPKVGFSEDIQYNESPNARNPFNMRRPLSRPGFSRANLPTLLSQTVFSSTATPAPAGANAPTRATPGLRRTSSLPDRLNRPATSSPAPINPRIAAPVFAPHPRPINTGADGPISSDEPAEHVRAMSRTTAVITLLISTGLVALCAEFLVDAIPAMTEQSTVSQAFIGLIILPVVGNAAEHVTAVMVASKNKMDLAIGVAVGSSIQIALFVTPLVVILGWILGKEMTLYFNLFETASLIVTAFVTNFLILDGRSNYLEGALLVSSYIIIAVCAFFYPDGSAQNASGTLSGIH